ncbi:MAG: DUF6089 family protein [Chitinophagaceae bacterium]
MTIHRNWNKIGIIIVLLGLQTSIIQAQSNNPRYEIGASLGAFVYLGDLTTADAGSFRTMRFALTIHGSKLLSRSFALRTNLAFSKLKGDDALYDDPEFRQHRNFKFTTPVLELSELLVWNVLGKNYDDRGFSPYLFAGAGLSFLKVRRDWSNFDAAYFGEASDLPARIEQDAAHKVPKVIPVIPMGFGLRYGISSRVAINAETSYRFTFTDYLDGFSQAVNPAKGDNYHSASIGVIYRIGKKDMLDCPKVGY